MAISEENGNAMVMPVAPMYGGNGGVGSFCGDGGWWILLLFILLAGGNGWGNGFGGGVDTLYPWMNQSAQISDGFRDQALNASVGAVQNGLSDIQMANMQNAFSLQSQLASCCCENRLASADLKYTIATENCADRSALADGVREIIANQTAGIQRILDQMCNDKIDAKNEKIADLERELAMATLAASQTAQTAQIIAATSTAARTATTSTAGA